MSKARQKPKRRTLPPPKRRLFLPSWVLLGGGILVVVVGAFLALSYRGRTEDGSAAGGAPQLVVDQKEIDLGRVPVEKMVTAAFTVSNTGDGPLRVLGEPAVELIEGC